MSSPPSKKPDATKNPATPKKFYYYKLFWALLLLGVVITIVGLGNWALNNPKYQHKTARTIYKFKKIDLKFKDISFNLFAGEVSGKDLDLTVEKTNLKMQLKEFRISYNPLYLLIAKFKITKIQAREIWLDTSNLIKSDQPSKKIQVPDFLKRIKLKQAQIDRFFWSYPNGDYLAINKINLTSKFGSVIYKSLLHLVVNDITLYTKKLHAYIDDAEMDGFFLLDFSQPHILDQSKITISAKYNNILLAPYRQPKPWLTDRGWDKDLEPTLKKYYPNEIPKDRTYLFINNFSIDAQKTKQSMTVSSLKINYEDHFLVGQGSLQSLTNNIKFRLQTQTPMPLSKLPLGQSKFRQAFEKFSLDINGKGKFKNIDINNVQISVKAALLGNNVNPPMGDAKISLEGLIQNSTLSTQNLKAALSSGTILGNGTFNLKTLNTHLKATATDFDAQTVVRLFSSINIPSIVNATGTISGKVNNPRINLNLNTDNATYEFLNFGKASGMLMIENKNLTLDVRSVGSTIGQSELTLKAQDIFSSFDNVMKLNSKFTSIDIRELLKANSLSGKIGGTFNLNRAKAIVKASGDFKSTDFSFFDHPIGDIDFKVAVNHNHLKVHPITIRLKKPQKTLTARQGLDFHFTPTGYTFKGSVIDTLRISGDFQKKNKENIKLQFIPQNMALDIFSSLLPIEVLESSISGKIDANYSIYDPYKSSMKSSFSKMDFKTHDGQFKLNRTASIDYSNKAFQFRNFNLSEGQGNIVLNGALGLENNSSLKIKGNVDFTPLVDFNPFISESESPIELDLTLKENIFKPKVFGKVVLNKDTLRFREMGADLENMQGIIRFNGNKITFDQVNLNYDDAPVNLNGSIFTDYEQITGANLHISGQEVPLHPIDGLSLLSDLDITLKGQGNLSLGGTLNIVEGQYNRNFVITNFIIKPDESDFDEESSTLAGLPLSTKYKLRIKNTGDLSIKNNLAELEMNTDLDLVGTIENPNLIGQLDFLGGRINAFGIDFDDATGFAQFKKGRGLLPIINIVAKKEIQGHNISARVEGQAENLRLRLSSSPALSHREILSVIFFGQAPDQLSSEKRRNFTQTAAISQLASLLADPLNKVSGLDVLRVSSRRESANASIQRLSVGKKLSDRLDLSFTTDLGIEDPERAFEFQYQIFDNFYLIAAKDVVGGRRFRFDINYRFEVF